VEAAISLYPQNQVLKPGFLLKIANLQFFQEKDNKKRKNKQLSD